MDHDVELRTCHNFRHLRQCALCGGIGDGRKMLIGLEANGLPGLNHGKCVVGRIAQDKLFELPVTELGKLTVKDTSVPLMKRLLRRRTRR